MFPSLDTSTRTVPHWPGVEPSVEMPFDDNEYSLMAPFTQIAFIPKQKGYFLGSGESTPGAGDQTAEDENSAYRSTIVEFMENGVQNIKLLIPFPDTLNKVQPSSEASYKIRSIDILYKESNSPNIYTVESFKADDPIPTTGTAINGWNTPGNGGHFGKYTIKTELIHQHSYFQSKS